MTRIATSLLVFSATPALAHPGHVVAQGGHDHWIALAALSAALIVAGVAVARFATRARARHHHG